jgi:hypothetical protein
MQREPSQVHSSTQHAHVLLAIGSIQSSHRFVPEQRFVTSAFALPHVVDGDAQVHGFVDQHELPICNKPFQTLRGVG